MYKKNFTIALFMTGGKNIDKLIFLFMSLILLGIFFSLVSTSLIASSKLGTNSYYFHEARYLYIFRFNFDYFFQQPRE